MTKKLNRILLIDDNEDDNFFHRRVLSNADISHQIDEVENGLEAIEYLTNTGRFEGKRDAFPCPDLIFLDINMPIMNGWEFLEEYQKLPDNIKGKLGVIMLSTSQYPDDIEKARGFKEVKKFFSKPLKSKNIESIITQLFPILH